MSTKIAEQDAIDYLYRCDNFEERPQQIEFLKTVCHSFNNESITISEAGTGVGKSYAYLIPAFMWVLANRERVVISTGTINLQHQLLEKDIPAISPLFPKKIKAVLVKGRQNYICLRRFYDRMKEAELFDNKEDFDSISAWLETTGTGERSDLPFYPSADLWSDICSESEGCLANKCPFFESCFVQKVRREAAGANILVVNHHLLFSDLSVRNEGSENQAGILPYYSRVIFDEAHNLENSATSFFSGILNRHILAKILGQIYRKQGRREYGLIKFFRVFSSRQEDVLKLPELIRDILNALDSVEKIYERQGVYELGENDSASEQLLELLAVLGRHLNTMFTLLKEIYDELDSSKDKEIKEDNRLFETHVLLSKLNSCITFLFEFTKQDDSNIVWIDKRRFTSLMITPVSVAETLKDNVFGKLSNIIFVSATLSVFRKFDYFISRTGIGLLEKKPETYIFDSPFDYRNNVLLTVPDNLSDPGNPEYIQELADLIRKVLITSEGKGLVLFTSFSMLTAVYNLVKDDFIAAGLTLYKQGDNENKKLLEFFRFDCNSVLFATDSFWEGVDSPGETLSVLIICRLPFKVPSDPVVKARMELIEKNGGNSFMQYSLPEAVIKLRQGFGRLIRRSDDRGIVLITDNRIITKFYGKTFLSSLPETKRFFGHAEKIADNVEKFLYP